MPRRTYQVSFLGLLFAVIGLGGCSTHSVQLQYEPTTSTIVASACQARAALGSIRDERSEESTWFGAIRGGYGTPLKQLHAEQAISAVVSDALAEELKTRGLMAYDGNAAARADDSIDDLQRNYYWIS